MTTPVPPDVECEQEHAALKVSDVAAAAEFYRTKLGFKIGFMFGDPPNITGLNLGNVQMFLERGEPNPKGCSVYFVVGDADELYEFQRSSGVEIVVPPEDRFYGLRDYRVRDLHGYELSFGHHLHNAGPAIEIERVDVSVRLEKRLARAASRSGRAQPREPDESVRGDVPAHARRVGPHGDRTLKYIQKLKEKHGIDYDSHGSYRFVEW